MEVKVVDNATTASVSAKTLYLPATWVQGRLDPAVSAMLEGVLDHECAGHSRHTDFAVYATYAKQGNTKAFLLNVLEDIRIETCAMRIFPGTAANLLAMVIELTKRDFFGAVSKVGTGPLRMSLCNAVLVVGRAKLLHGQGGPLGPLAAAHEKYVSGKFGSLWQDVWTIVAQAPLAPDTEAITVLVDRIMDAIDAKSAEDPADKGQSDPQEGESGSGDGDTDSEIESARDLLDEAESVVVGSGDLGKMFGDVMDKSCVKKLSGYDCRPHSPPRSRNTPIPGRWKEAARLIRSRLGQDFEVLMESKLESRKSVGTIGRRLVAAKLPRVRTLDARIFGVKTVAEGLSTAVFIVKDGSNSMTSMVRARQVDSRFSGWTRNDIAGGALYCLAELLELHDIPFAASHFDDYHGPIKHFDERWSSIKHAKAAMYAADGNTIMSRAMLDAIGALAERQEERRLLILIVDGNSSYMESVRTAYRDAEMLGIEVVTVLIGERTDSHVGQYAAISKKDLFICNALDSLPRTVIDAVRASL